MCDGSDFEGSIPVRDSGLGDGNRIRKLLRGGGGVPVGVVDGVEERDGYCDVHVVRYVVQRHL